MLRAQYELGPFLLESCFSVFELFSVPGCAVFADVSPETPDITVQIQRTHLAPLPQSRRDQKRRYPLPVYKLIHLLIIQQKRIAG